MAPTKDPTQENSRWPLDILSHEDQSEYSAERKGR